MTNEQPMDTENAPKLWVVASVTWEVCLQSGDSAELRPIFLCVY